LHSTLMGARNDPKYSAHVAFGFTGCLEFSFGLEMVARAR
jgi:hypothetical protein